jgi:Tfp pilus assembly protein PilF
MSISQLQDFVDREEELALFHQMLSAERQERVLDICGGGGTESLRISRELCDRDGKQKVIGNQGELYLKQGQCQEARTALDKALQIAPKLGN